MFASRDGYTCVETSRHPGRYPLNVSTLTTRTFSGGTDKAISDMYDQTDNTYETEVVVNKDHAVFIGSLDALGVHDGPTGGCNVAGSAALGAVHVVREGEECV